MKQLGIHMLFIAALYFIVHYHQIQGLSSKLISCFGTKCESQLEVQVSLAYGSNKKLQFDVSSTVNEKGETVQMAPINVTITKTAPRAVYPLIYKKTFNAKPTENIIYKTDFLVPTCDDSAKSGSPTCGWVRDDKGQKIPDSQGFCCSCSVGQMFGDNSASTRGNLNCGFLQMRSSAHCMRLHEVYWDAYELEGYTIDFEITVDLGELGSVKLSPSKQVVQLSNGGRAELDGDFSLYRSIPLFESKFLFVPSSPAAHQTVLEGFANWMFVDKNLVTLTGTECDKIGVSYSQFRNQPNACTQPPMSCLGNQIEDLRLQDKELMKSGQKSGKYLVSNFGDFYINSTSGGKMLSKMLDETSNSQIRLLINAESVKFINIKSAASIEKALVEPFDSLSREGELKVMVKNKGTSLCPYIVTVTDCSSNILPVVQQNMKIESQQSSEVSFQIRTEQQLATTNQCKVSLLFTDGEKIQEVIVVFDSKDYAYENAVTGGAAQTGQAGTEGDHSNSQCKCNSPFDVICIVLHSCIDYIIGWVAAIVGIITIPIIFVFMWRCGLFGLLFQSCKCCACCCSLLPRGIMKCLIGPYKKKKHRRKSKKSKKKRNSSENSERKSKKKKKQRKNRYRSSMRMNDSLPYHPSSYVMMNPQSMARYYKPSPSYEMKEIEYEPVARYYK